MASERKAIRAEVVSILKGTNTPPLGGATAAGQRVFPTRTNPIFEIELPCIAVYTLNEPAERYNEAPRRNKRTVRLAVEIVHELNDTLDDALDDICEQVENLLLPNDTLNGKAADVQLVETEIVTLPEGQRPIGAARISFDVTYYKFTHPDPSEPLEEIRTEWDLAQPDGQIEAEDIIALPQPAPPTP